MITSKGSSQIYFPSCVDGRGREESGKVDGGELGPRDPSDQAVNVLWVRILKMASMGVRRLVSLAYKKMIKLIGYIH